ncbi:vascular cell adhesion protein 1-like isoform X2 [Lepisosteus oculatus]|uniref:vascular cell adhesion protein 1-like isoform X2 n=1 Tax=Lepisosteus oculatus TaxID=7918 RepID=UPI0035F52031
MEMDREKSNRVAGINLFRLCLGLLVFCTATRAVPDCPLEISPQRAVVRYGDPVTVNCTTTQTPRGMGWEAPVGATGMKTGVQSVTWSVSSLTDWTAEPKCYGNFLTEPKQCRKNLNISLYKYPDSVSLSSDSPVVQMVEGRQYQLQCAVQNIAPVQYLTVNWYRGQTLIHSQDFFTNTTRTPVNVSATLLFTPDRADSGQQLTCEAELNLGPEGPKPPPANQSDPLSITVLYGPEITGCPLSVDVEEHHNLQSSVTCTAEGSPPPETRWVKDGQQIDPSVKLTRTDGGQFTYEATNTQGSVSHTVTVEVRYGPEITGCPLSVDVEEHHSLQSSVNCTAEGSPPPETRWVKDGQQIDPSVKLTRTDEGQFTYEATNTQGTVNHTVTVEVRYGPEITGCPLSVDVEEHHSLESSVNCTAEGSPPPETRWVKDGQQIDPSVKLTRTDEGQFTYEATNTQGTVSHTVNVTVLYKPIIRPWQTSVDGEKGSTIVFTCAAEGNPPPWYRWEYYDAGNVKELTTTTASNITITGATAFNIGEYSCTATNKLGMDTKILKVRVIGAVPECPLEISPQRAVVRYGDPVTANCTATQTPRGMGWEATVGSTGMKTGAQSVTWSVSSLTDWTAEPKCYGNFLTEPKQCRKNLNISLYKYPDRVSLSPVDQMVEGRQYQLQCEVQNIAPVQYLTVNWYRGQTLIHSQDFFTNTTRTPVNVSVRHLFTPDRADNGQQFTCEAELNLGPEGPQPPHATRAKPLEVTVLYKPVSNRTHETVGVLKGDTVVLNCSADGNPAPEYRWEHSGAGNVVSSHTNGVFTITGITKENSGNYTCSASNTVGSHSVTFTVEVIEDYLPIIAGMVAVVVVIICLIFAFIYSVYYKNTKMGRYSLKNGKPCRQNGYVAQNGKEVGMTMGTLTPCVKKDLIDVA